MTNSRFFEHSLAGQTDFTEILNDGYPGGLHNGIGGEGVSRPTGEVGVWLDSPMYATSI